MKRTYLKQHKAALDERDADILERINGWGKCCARVIEGPHYRYCLATVAPGSKYCPLHKRNSCG